MLWQTLMHWRTLKIIPHWRVSLWLLVILSMPIAQANVPVDLRVLVDVSGSMKTSDPKTIRGPATALLAALLPQESFGGIWLFGTDVRGLVPYGSVDARWSALAAPLTASIRSNDRYTHIESALSTALRVRDSDGTRQCHVVMLTDGLVDVQGGSDASRASRDRILKRLIPEAVSRQCRLHTIALSDRADIELLRQMALATGGLFTRIESAGDLVPVMLDALELAIRSQQLPVINDEILVDAEVSQLRIIQLGDNPTFELLQSGRDPITEQSAGEGFSLYAGEGYKILMWSNPEPGRYRLYDSNSDDLRILIDSPTRLDMTELPGTLSPDVSVGLTIGLSREGQPVVQSDSPVSRFEAQFGADGEPITLTPSADGTVAAQLDSLPTGRGLFTIRSLEPQRHRQIQRRLEVLESAPITAIGNNTAQAIQLTPIGQSDEANAANREASRSDDKSKTTGSQSPQSMRDSVTQFLGLDGSDPSRLPGELTSWPLWQLVGIGLGVLALLGFIVLIVLKPKTTVRREEH
jgi:hypothetical protein